MNKTVVTTLILELVNASDDGIGSIDIYNALKKRMRDLTPLFHSTIKRRLSELINENKIIVYGRARAIRYRKVPSAQATPAAPSVDPFIPLSDFREQGDPRLCAAGPSKAGSSSATREIFLEYYKPNLLDVHTLFRMDITNFSPAQRSGRLGDQGHLAGGTYPDTDMVNRLLIDLSWASSAT